MSDNRSSERGVLNWRGPLLAAAIFAGVFGILLLMAHLNQIDVLSPGWYDANADGSITGYARRDVIDAAHANGIAIIPLVVNKDVDPGVGHAPVGRRHGRIVRAVRAW